MYRMASSVLILGFFFLSIIALRFNFPTWVLILLSLVNDFTAMATSKDSVRAAPAPLRWNMAKVTGISVLIGMSGFLGSFLLLYLALPQYGNWWPALGGLRPLAECEVVAVMYLNLAWTIQLNIFATRNKSFSFITKKVSSTCARAPADLERLPFLRANAWQCCVPRDELCAPGGAED